MQQESVMLIEKEKSYSSVNQTDILIMKDYRKLPYRDGVGMCIINKKKEIFVGKRISSKFDGWQMPQGGIDLGETPSKAAMREMLEEIGTSNGVIMSETKSWYCYDVPRLLVPKLWNGAYRGQRQKWFLIMFEGEDSEINVDASIHPEFYKWQWVDYQSLPDIIIPFKRKLYQSVLAEFQPFLT